MHENTGALKYGLHITTSRLFIVALCCLIINFSSFKNSLSICTVCFEMLCTHWFRSVSHSLVERLHWICNIKPQNESHRVPVYMLAHNAEKILKILEMNMCVRFRVTNKPVSFGSVIRFCCSCWYICAYISRFCCCLKSYTIRFLSCVSLMFILFKSLPFIKFSNASSAICIVYTLTHNILTMWKYI